MAAATFFQEPTEKHDGVEFAPARSGHRCPRVREEFGVPGGEQGSARPCGRARGEAPAVPCPRSMASVAFPDDTETGVREAAVARGSAWRFLPTTLF